MNSRAAARFSLALLIAFWMSVLLLLAAARLNASSQAAFPVASYTPSVTPTSTPQINTATPTATPVPPSATRTLAAGCLYTVRPGDTLYAIAVSHNTSVDALLAANPNLNGDANSLSIGMDLQLSDCASATPSPEITSTVPVSVRAGGQVYTVQPGDNLASIARSHGVSMGAILQANNLSSSGIIRVGQTLIIPVEPTATTSAADTATAVPPTVSASTIDTAPPFEIRIGETKRADLEKGQTHRWTLQVGSERHLTIRVTADEFGRPDAFVEVYDPNNRLIAADDDSGENLNPLIENLPVRPNQSYIIVVSSRNNSAGSYQLSIE